MFYYRNGVFWWTSQVFEEENVYKYFVSYVAQGLYGPSHLTFGSVEIISETPITSLAQIQQVLNDTLQKAAANGETIVPDTRHFRATPVGFQRL